MEDCNTSGVSEFLPGDNAGWIVGGETVAVQSGGSWLRQSHTVCYCENMSIVLYLYLHFILFSRMLSRGTQILFCWTMSSTCCVFTMIHLSAMLARRMYPSAFLGQEVVMSTALTTSTVPITYRGRGV